MNSTNMINGVNVSQLHDTVKAIKETPSLARFIFRADNKWAGGAYNRSTIKSFYGAGQEDTTRTESFVLEMDEPAVLLGTNKAANAGEIVLHALAGCLTSSLVLHAAARGIKIEAIESELEGTVDLQGFLGLDDQTRNGYEKINVKFKIKGDNFTEEQKMELCEMAKRYSPVFDMLSNPVPVSVSIENESVTA